MRYACITFIVNYIQSILTELLKKLYAPFRCVVIDKPSVDIAITRLSLLKGSFAVIKMILFKFNH